MDKTHIDPFVSAFVESTLKGMQDLIRKGDEVCPQVFLFAREGAAPAILPLLGLTELFQSKEGKRRLPGVIKNAWKGISASKPALKLVAVLMLSDAWVEVVSNEQFDRLMRNGRDSPFAPKPEMAESLVIIVYLADQEFQYQWPYVRGREGVVFAAEATVEKTPDGPKALLMGLWPL